MVALQNICFRKSLDLIGLRQYSLDVKLLKGRISLIHFPPKLETTYDTQMLFNV